MYAPHNTQQGDGNAAVLFSKYSPVYSFPLVSEALD